MAYTLSLTTAGQAKIMQAIATSSAVTLTQIGVGSSVNPLTAASTALGQERYRADVNAQSVVGNVVTVNAIVPANQGGWYIRELGIFDVDGTLIAFSAFPETYKPDPATDDVGVNLTLTASLDVINAASVNVTVASAALALADLSNVEEISARVQVLSGTDAALATEVLALGELAAPTDRAWIRKGDGVTPGGVKVGAPPIGVEFIIRSSDPSAGTNKGGSGAPGAAGANNLAASVDIRGGDGGSNSASGTGVGGAGGSLLAIFRGVPVCIRAGSGGAANGNNNGGRGGDLNVGPNSPGIIRIEAGSGGVAGSGGSAGAGGNISYNFNESTFRIVAGNGGNGGTGASGGIGGNSGPTSTFNFVAGNGGNGGASGETGGNGGNMGSISANGGNGGNGTGGSPGGAGGASGTINVSGSAASGATAGAAGGSITTTANGNRAGGSINTSAGASFAGGSIELSHGGNTLTIRGTAGQFGHRVAVPANSAAAGLVGQWASDDSFFYVYGGTGWRRIAASTF